MNMHISKMRRAEIERQIEAMIALLDAIDDDTDIEENGDEFDYNRIEYGTGECMGYPREDDEPNGDEEEEHEELEPWLGWTDTLDQARGASLRNRRTARR
jgi:hypothetical protein